MHKAFDPYRKWLAIPEDSRPPTHYQLLGISPDERFTPREPPPTRAG
jgi:hypothetical protein